MANEMTCSKRITASKGGVEVNKTASESVTVSGDDMLQGSQVIGTTWEAVGLGEISGVPTEVQIKNLDATNFVQLAVANDDTGIFAKLLGGTSPNGRSAQWPPNAATIYAKADTAACRISVVAVEA